MKFGTVINCIDGRVQYPVLDYLKRNFELDFFDAANEAGPLKILTERNDKCRLISLKEQIKTSLEVHGSRFIAVVGHHDCAGNPVERGVQEKQIVEALDYLSKAFGDKVLYVGLYVNERWEVEESVRIEPAS
jgi:hypothetical protein